MKEQLETEAVESQAVSQALETKEVKEENTESTEEVIEEAVSEDGAEETDTVEEEKPKKLGGYKAKLLRERAKTEYLEAKLRELESSKAVVKDVPQDEPNQSDFESPAEYYKALGKWTFQQERKADEAERLKDEEKSKAVKTQETYKQRAEDFKQTQKDFEDVIENFIEEHGDFKFSRALDDLIIGSEVGPAVLYELAKNKENLDRINSLSPLEAAKEFGKLEVKLTQTKQTIKKSAAPPPVKPISGTKTESVKNIYDPNLPYSEFEKMMDELERKRKRA